MINGINVGLNEIIQIVEIGTYPPASITELNGKSKRTNH